MLFPYAECNLRQYMEHYTFSSPTKRNVLWLLAQLLGLSNALRGIHNLSNPEASFNLLAPQQNLRISGWHHDLKPENILYFKGPASKEGSFKIADFGSSKVHTYRSGTGSNNTRTPNGTPTYEPPEAAKEGATSRPYDMWSMGCVFLEMLIWAVYDYDAVNTFRRSRDGKRFPDDANYVLMDDAFWQIDILGTIHHRDSVSKWLGDLGKELEFRNLQPFQEVFGLLYRMLDTNKQTRITALNLWDTLSRIGDQTRVDLETYPDNSLLDQNTPKKTHRQTLSLSTKEPDRDVSDLASPIVVVKSDSDFLPGDHLTALPQSPPSTRFRRRNSSLSDNTPYSDPGMMDHSISDISSTCAQASNSTHENLGRTPNISNTKHDRGSLGIPSRAGTPIPPNN